MNDINMGSYGNFLHKKKDRDGEFVMIPKKLLIDSVLTPQEKIIWMILACFQFKAENQIYPNRRRLAKLINVKTQNSISKATRHMQDKNYLTKYYDSYKRVIYYLHYCKDVDVSIFKGGVDPDVMIGSMYNRLHTEYNGKDANSNSSNKSP